MQISYKWRNITFWSNRIIEQAKFTYCHLRKAFDKQTKTNENQGRKQIDAIMKEKERQVNFI